MEEPMAYYVAAFYYPRPWCGAGGPTHITSITLCGALIVVTKRLLKNIEHRHCYTWPDGSLYMFIKSELNPTELKSLIDSRVKGPIRLCDLSEIDETYKGVSGNTVKEYFEKFDK